MRRQLLALLLTLLALPIARPLTVLQKLELTIDTIMRGYGLEGYAPRAVRWSRDGQLVYFEWKQFSDPTEGDFHTWVVGRDGKGLRKLSDAEEKNAPPRNAN